MAHYANLFIAESSGGEMKGIVQISIIALLISAYLYWGIKTLARERWQFLAAVPVVKRENGEWDGINLTWYGLLTANAYAVAVACLFFLMGCMGVPLAETALLVVAMLAICVPASRLVARIVEKKAHTFTVGGAVFVGVLVAPWIVLLLNRTVFTYPIPPAAALAGFAIAYSFGEGLGRLACISFGCCYGKPLSKTQPWLRKLFCRHSFVFAGKTRKIAYADNLDGEQVLPVQALTSGLYAGCGFFSIFLFVQGLFVWAFMVAMAFTQEWRVYSETLRADYRGEGNISAYQVMGLASIPYGGAAALIAPVVSFHKPEITTGINALWHPGPLIFIQLIWVSIFIYTGRSTVTAATISFRVNQDRI
jgi:prolipoprotein diacylglyceryltransferase